MLKRPELFANSLHLSYYPLPSEIRELVSSENWRALDQAMKELTAPGGRLFKFLQDFHDFNSIEFIISVRDAANDWEEDGIWHDDGSRPFAFSLSLTLEQPKGGRLSIRRKGEGQTMNIPTPDFGGIIMFLTGVYGFEHKINRVTKGRRVIIAGWCS